ncbi:MAG: hypothetical protein MnENMB40S_22690 [Rhizobiaceae bacterium MnEN-MB40S]|nr:MAG: hypothetical protein MnENMB40S_22690 [Rhizobiaceae bacterium MnEN-MB40S]
MIEPALALRSVIRAHLVSDEDITDLVPADDIRAGSTRPENFPTIILAGENILNRGRAAAGQYVATVFLDIHIWAVEDGLDKAQTIGAAVAKRLIDCPETDGFEIDEFKHNRTVWMRDPDPGHGHGVLSYEATIRWTI